MKYCACLADAPPGLAHFRAEHPAETDWESFRQGGRDRYLELADALTDLQRGLCAFCEAPLFTGIPTPARQIEHWLPKSNGGHPDPEITFSVANLHAACLGGAKPHLRPPFGNFGLAGDNVSCGQKKGDQDPQAIPAATRPFRPTELALSPPVFTVDLDGMLAANPDAIASGMPLLRVDETISFFGLNCERLKLARAEVRRYLDARLMEYEADEPVGSDPLDRLRSALSRLASDLSLEAEGPLPAFISVLRDFFGPANDTLFLPDPGWAVGCVEGHA